MIRFGPIVDEAEADLLEFRRELRRQRRRRAAVFGIVGVGLIVGSIAARRWAERLQEIQAASNVQMLLPRYALTASWGTLILGGVCLLGALVAAATTLGGDRRS